MPTSVKGDFFFNMLLTLLARIILTAGIRYLYSNRCTTEDLRVPPTLYNKTIHLLQKSTTLNCTGVVKAVQLLNKRRSRSRTIIMFPWVHKTPPKKPIRIPPLFKAKQCLFLLFRQTKTASFVPTTAVFL